ncbi:Ankyrin-2 [Xylographa opegraphella]|nr:Ankyrin-2 [Xylographa opegraphella]
MPSRALERYAGNGLLQRLIKAASDGNIDAVQDILAEWKEMPEPVPERGDEERLMYWFHPALAAAVNGGQLHMVSYLLDHEFRCDQPAVRTAIRRSSIDSLELFLRHGWKINQLWENVTPPSLSYAVETDDLQLVRWFLEHGAKSNAYALDHPWTPLTCAAGRGSLETAKMLFEYGGDPRRGSLLHAVARGTKPGRLAIYEYLLEKGVPINGLEFEDSPHLFKTWSPRGLGTPLHAAVTAKNQAMIVALLAKGADKNIKDTLGRTPLDRARSWGFASIVELLQDG